jgi:hypothetical protein
MKHRSPRQGLLSIASEHTRYRRFPRRLQVRQARFITSVRMS